MSSSDDCVLDLIAHIVNTSFFKDLLLLEIAIMQLPWK